MRRSGLGRNRVDGDDGGEDRIRMTIIAMMEIMIDVVQIKKRRLEL